ncbi:MAG TPA: DUF72 domain-containing protein [Chromatiales bacterium]|nr:DUF72 domain-containing protein [Chromatiales bacterium]
MSGRLCAGTSGWHYAHWRGVFYPEDLPPARWLAYYAQRFPCVEINNAFYRLPSEQAVQQWAREVPAHFRFAVKASRYITHVKRLRDCAEAVSRFLARMNGLGDYLGPVLFQLPGHWRPNLERLADFLELLPEDLATAFEFRDPRWHTAETVDLLAAYGAAFCVYHAGEERSPLWITAPFAYVRMHGPLGWYQGEYGRDGLAWLTRWLQEVRPRVERAYVFFNNDAVGWAIRDALALRALADPVPDAG